MLSKLIPEHVGFALLRSMIGSENVFQPPNQSDSKKANGDLVTAFSRAQGHFQVFFVLIGSQ